jgi:uncharacterized membrane protein YfcA
VADAPEIMIVLWLLALASGLLTMIAGFGGNLVLVPLATLVIPTRDAVLLGMLIGIQNPVMILTGHHRDVDRRALGTMLLGGLPLAALGMLLHRRAPEAALTLLVATVALGAGLRSWRDRAPTPGHPWRWLLLPVGGFVQGAVATSGPLFVAWLRGVTREKGAFRSTICAFWVCLNPPIVAVLLATSATPWRHLERAAWCLPAVVAAYVLGGWLHRRLAPAGFQRFVVLLLLASGLAAGVKGVQLLSTGT